MTTSTTTRKLAALVERLWKRTEAGDLSWEPTSHDSRFEIQLKDHLLQIQQDDEDYTLTLGDQSGTIVERVSDSELREADPHIYGKLVALYREARRSALKVEEAIDDILGELD